jgi:polynucleotide 5'-hydroxyl-kinase GRC3/NOL9
VDELHEGLIDDLVRSSGVVMLLGAPDTGKTTFARRLLAGAVAAGKTAAYVDAETDQTTAGPPACIGLRIVREQADLESLHLADRLQFTGAIAPHAVVLPHVVATANLVESARGMSDLVVIDTSGAISGVGGQTLKYHKMELCRPDIVVGLQRGAELEPVLGMLRRFFAAEVTTAPVDPDVRPASPQDRSTHRAKAFAAAFSEPLQRWRVRNTVFAPTLPEGLDLERLQGVLVGLYDREGGCLGLGVLEREDDALKVITNHGEGMRGLRLGSLRLDLDTYEVERVRLREVMFGV